MSFLERLSQGLAKTREALLGRVASIVPGLARSLSPDDADSLESALLAADVGPETTDRMIEGVRRRLGDRAFTGGPLEALRAEVEALLRRSEAAAGGARPGGAPAAEARPRPHVTLVVGVNGTGKTTTIAKLAHGYRREGETVLLIAADTFRAAAADQLEVWAGRVGVDVVSAAPGADPASVAYDGMARAKSRSIDRVLVDTAGRLHGNQNLMQEVKKIRRVIEKSLPGAPQEVLLVLDATTGQNGLRQALEFHRALGLTGLILTKLDGTAKGGVVLAIAGTLGLPIRRLGVGEGLEDLLPFDAAAFAAALLPGPGDAQPAL